MKPLLTTVILGLSLTASGQTIVESMQTTNGDKELAMNIVGKKEGRPFKHKIHFDVTGMSQAQRDSLYQQTVQALGILGIKDVPGMKQPGTEPESQGEKVVFRCETCEGKGSVEVYGDNFLLTRSFNTRRSTQPFFPLTLRLGSGEYRLVYKRKGSRKTESNFSVRAGEVNEVKVE